MFTCSTCRKEWPENYCPECAHTIERSPAQRSPVTQPASTTSRIHKTSAKSHFLELPRRYPYNIRWRDIFLMGLGLLTFPFSVYWATHNTRGMIINGVIRLGPTGATVVYWVMAALFAAAGLMAILATAGRFRGSSMIELGPDALLLPQGLYRLRTTRIAYSDIRAVSEIRISRTQYISFTAGGRKFSISAARFPDSTAYIELRDFLLLHT